MDASLSDYKLLLQAYRLGLRIGLITKADVVAWADEIIMHTDEPDYTFIALSMSRDDNELIGVINQTVPESDDLVITRALLSEVWRRFDNQTINVAEAVFYIESLPRYKLTDYESLQAYDLEDYEFLYGHANEPNLKFNVIRFLSIYQRFNFDNYPEWNKLSDELTAEIEIKKSLECRHDLYMYPQPQIIPATPKKVSINLIALLAILLLLSVGFLLLTGYIKDGKGESLSTVGIICIVMAIVTYRNSKQT
ncbi:hypothetical protein INP83_18190 [Mucilaginibacter sp. 21P]|uniref:hypothetical protein n=1 Tax=Mucilaginibacter sp. 21P TaxID=2778902 RepID=UPI001C56A459|nr:hypothetical protein [Mucilaginibacter sp. 21P]QXV64990.1 hypothetical protein INP83_18190 [Mucilaginibacter sp. 21P]